MRRRNMGVSRSVSVSSDTSVVCRSTQPQVDALRGGSRIRRPLGNFMYRSTNDPWLSRTYLVPGGKSLGSRDERDIVTFTPSCSLDPSSYRVARRCLDFGGIAVVHTVHRRIATQRDGRLKANCLPQYLHAGLKRFRARKSSVDEAGKKEIGQWRLKTNTGKRLRDAACKLNARLKSADKAF